MMLLMRLEVSCDLAEFCMDESKSPRNCRSDVWYMTFTSDISTIRK